MFTGIDFEKAIDYYRDGKEVVVLDRASVGKNGKSGYDTFSFEELFKDLDFLVDVPAVVNSDFEQTVQDRVDLDTGGVCLSCGLHGQKQRADVCGSDIRHFQVAQSGVYPVVEIALISASTVFTHGHSLGRHKDFFAVLP